ncbi:MAG: cysteine desulfurase family protein [Oscillospiraceae bacterium]
MHYLDNAATTPVCKEAADAALAALSKYYANPSSLYSSGVQSEAALTSARCVLASELRCKCNEIYFTASGSEGNNIAILGAAKTRKAWGRHIVVTGYEHPSVSLTVEALCNDGFDVTKIMPNEQGNINIDEIVNAVTKETILVTAMHVNNETGAYIDVKKLALAVKNKNSRTAVHIDGVQAFCKQIICLEGSAIDSYAVSGHKIHAPKGVGAVYLRQGYHILPVLYGGGQERGMRPGTENIAFAVSFAEAVNAAKAHYKKDRENIKLLSDTLWQGLAEIDEITRNSPTDAVWDIANISVGDVKSETMLHYLENRDIMVSSGSACSKGEESHTLKAMGLSKHRIDTAMRISFAADNTIEDVKALLNAVQDGLIVLAKMRV